MQKRVNLIFQFSTLTLLMFGQSQLERNVLNS